MSYSLIQLPFSGSLKEKTKSELRQYFEWFQMVLPERVRMLEIEVQTTKGFEDWKADFTPESLKKLGEWFFQVVETRQLSEVELIKERSNLPDYIDLPKDELTLKTMSVAYDIGMYFGQTMYKNVRNTEWILYTKKDFDYGSPVLTNIGNMVLNPIWICRVLADCFASKKYTSQRLHELYEIWKKNLLKSV